MTYKALHYIGKVDIDAPGDNTKINYIHTHK